MRKLGAFCSCFLAALPAAMAQIQPCSSTNPVLSTWVTVPQIADGAGWRTSFIVGGTAGRSVPIYRILFWDSTGQPLTVKMAGIPQASSSFCGTNVPERGIVFLETEGTPGGTLKQGWAEIQSNVFIGGYAVFRQSVPGRPDFEAVGTQARGAFAVALLPIDDAAGATTSIAIVNTAFSEGVALATFRDTDGRIINSEALTLRARSHAAFAIPERFPYMRDRRGTLELSVTGVSVSVALLALRFNSTGPFTALMPF